MKKTIFRIASLILLGAMVAVCLLILVQLFKYPFYISTYAYVISLIAFLCSLIPFNKIKRYIAGLLIGALGFAALCFYIYSLHDLIPAFDPPSTPVNLDDVIYVFSPITFDHKLLRVGKTNELLSVFLMAGFVLPYLYYSVIMIHNIKKHFHPIPQAR